MEEVFGSFPSRPSHPDFWSLSEIVLSLDGAMSERGDADPEDVLVQMASEVGDPNSISYLATQRAMRVHGVQTRSDLVAKADDVVTTSLVYIEAIIIGARMERKRHG